MAVTRAGFLRALLLSLIVEWSACAKVTDATDAAPESPSARPVKDASEGASSAAPATDAGTDRLDAADGVTAVDAATADAGKSACQTPLVAPPLGTCILSDAIEMGPGFGQLSLELDGEVTEVGEGPPPDGCASEYQTLLGRGFAAISGTPTHVRWLRLEDADGRRAVIGVLAPNVEWSVQPGSAVSLRFDRTGGSFEPTKGRLELRSMNGELLFWFGTAGTVSELQDPVEVSLFQGEELCRHSEQCFPMWAQYDLAARAGPEQRSYALSYGEQADLGGFTVTHGGIDLQIGPGSGCPDAFIAWAAASIWPTP